MPGIDGHHAAGSSAVGEDAVGVDDDAATSDPGLATRISSPLRKGGTASLAWGRDCPCAWDRWSSRCWVFRRAEDAVGVDDDVAAADPRPRDKDWQPAAQGGGTAVPAWGRDYPCAWDHWSPCY